MKKSDIRPKKLVAPVLAAAALSLAAVSCADLGMGVDVSSDGVSPYWYGNGYVGDTYWNTPVWNYGPVYNYIPPAPPVAGVRPVPGPRPHPVPVRPGQIQNRPEETPSQPAHNPSNGIGWNPGPMIGNIQRPGNGGLANPQTVPQGRPIRTDAGK